MSLSYYIIPKAVLFPVTPELLEHGVFDLETGDKDRSVKIQTETG